MRIAVFTKNWLGDVIFETPAFRALKENFPDSHVIAITPRRCAEILETNPCVDEIITFEESNIFNQLKLIYQLKKRNIDRGYLFHRSSTRARLLRWAGIRERIGYDTKGRGRFLTHPIQEPPSPVHQVQYFLNLLSASGHRVTNDYQYEFHFTPEELKKTETLLKENHLNQNRLIAMNPGANWTPKRWPPAYFRQLADRLIKRFGIQVVLTGSSEDRSVADEILNHSAPSSIVSLCGKTTVRELGALFSQCQLVISNDTGPLHIAAGVGTNVLGIFGPTASRETAPLGRGKNVIIHYFPEGASLPWFGKKFPYPWMELISVDQVFETIEKEHLIHS